VSAALERVRRWTRFDHVRQPQSVPRIVVRWRAEYIRRLTAADRLVLANVR
jgi:hypothetical protein